MNLTKKSLRPAVTLLLCAALLAAFDGCSCSKNPFSKANTNAADAKKNPDETLEEMEARRKKALEEKEEKPDFETTRLVVLPADDSPMKNQVKPGHWFSALQTMKANNFDFSKGDLDAQCVDTRGTPIPLPGTNYDLRTSRPVSLPKGQQKHFDLLLFANMPRSKGSINFMTRLRPRGGGREVDWKHEATTRMKPFQNHIVVLAEFPDSYSFVKSLRSIKPGRSGDDFLTSELDYFIKVPTDDRRVDLPSHPLTWSNIAYVVWDKFDPEVLNSAQQQSLVDWLNWGGQLIINGPRTLEPLAASMLAPYLPARPGAKVTKLTDEEVATLNRFCSFDERGSRHLKIDDEKNRPDTIELQLTEGATFVQGTAELVAEVRVGRGRVVTTAFNIPHATLRAWDSFDCFFNACLLDRPARQFDQPSDSGIVDNWASAKRLTRDDPRVTSKVRYFSRDAESVSTRTSRSIDQDSRQEQKLQEELAMQRGNPRSQIQQQIRRANIQRQLAQQEAAASELEPEDQTGVHSPDVRASLAFGVAGFARDDYIGVAGWSDQSDVSSAARSSLERSAGISVPSIEFIAKVLGIYLLLLVPLNWLLFRVMGRVEWAWAMVPLIAIAGAIGVINAAQLDIGFARSRTEIAILEVQPNYERAHLTRYVGFYTSLSSSYEVSGDDESTLIQPLASDQLVNDRRVSLYQGSKVSLSGFNVISNSTGMVHSEQMVHLGGKFLYDDGETKTLLENQTQHQLTSAAIVRRTQSGIVEAAWVGDLEPKSKRTDIAFSTLEDHAKMLDFPEWESDSATSKRSSEGDLNVRALFDIATDPMRLGLGETILVGFNEQIMDGITVKPEAAQVTAKTVFVVQLRHAIKPAPQRDNNNFAVMARAKAKADNEDNDYNAGTYR